MWRHVNIADSFPTWINIRELQVRLCRSSCTAMSCVCVDVDVRLFTCQQSSPTNHTLKMWVGLSASVRHHTHTHARTNTHSLTYIIFSWEIRQPYTWLDTSIIFHQSKPGVSVCVCVCVCVLDVHEKSSVVTHAAQTLVSYSRVTKLSIVWIPFSHCMEYIRCTHTQTHTHENNGSLPHQISLNDGSFPLRYI